MEEADTRIHEEYGRGSDDLPPSEVGSVQLKPYGVFCTAQLRAFLHRWWLLTAPNPANRSSVQSGCTKRAAPLHLRIVRHCTYHIGLFETVQLPLTVQFTLHPSTLRPRQPPTTLFTCHHGPQAPSLPERAALPCLPGLPPNLQVGTWAHPPSCPERLSSVLRTTTPDGLGALC